MSKKAKREDPKARAYLESLYRLAKTGRSIKKRLKFMKSRKNGNVRISHVNTPAEGLAILEVAEIHDITDYC
ncbi:MAG: hypothetical protein NTW11_02210 [Candidatus Staskawiczbacteria bacterium]|nr:hypothetical protein [Candidatus Staskawiczbacteria bacterium]